MSKPRGLAALPPERRREIARMGGLAVQNRPPLTIEARRAGGRACQAKYTPEERRERARAMARARWASRQLELWDDEPV